MDAVIDGDVARIPLHNRAGDVVAWAVVEAVDAARLGRHRWYRHARGLAARARRVGSRVISSYLQRDVFGLPPGAAVGRVIWLNGDRLDCRRANLRLVPYAAAYQRRRPPEGKTSRHRGVSWYAPLSKWRAHARRAGKVYHLGYFDDELAAAAAAADWRREHMPYALEPPPARE